MDKSAETAHRRVDMYVGMVSYEVTSAMQWLAENPAFHSSKAEVRRKKRGQPPPILDQRSGERRTVICVSTFQVT